MMLFIAGFSFGFGLGAFLTNRVRMIKTMRRLELEHSKIVHEKED